MLKVEAFDYVFMTVRHPVARIVSEYGMRHQDREARSTEGFSSWLNTTLDRYGRNPFLCDNHIRPQIDFMIPGCDVYKQEDKFDAAWVDHLADRLGTSLVKSASMGQRLANSHAGEKFSLLPSDLNRLEAFYAADFDAFGYPVNETAASG
jgi:hypothetical protein